jgi:hypothetical protein
MSRRSPVSTAHTPATHRLRLAKRLAQSLSKTKRNTNCSLCGAKSRGSDICKCGTCTGDDGLLWAQTLMGTFKTFAMYAGAVICLGGLIFAGIRMMSGRFQDAIPGLFGALFGAGVLGWGAGWISSLTGQSF